MRNLDPVRNMAHSLLQLGFISQIQTNEALRMQQIKKGLNIKPYGIEKIIIGNICNIVLLVLCEMITKEIKSKTT